VWLFTVAELFGYDFQTILHFADGSLNGYAWIQWLGIASSPYSDSYLHTLKLSFLNVSFQDSLSSNFTLDGNQFS